MLISKGDVVMDGALKIISLVIFLVVLLVSTIAAVVYIFFG